MRFAFFLTLMSVSIAYSQDEGSLTKSRKPGRVVHYTPGESIPLVLPLSDAARHLVTVVSFPEPVTRALVPWNDDDISIDTDGREVMLKLLKPAEGDLAFRGRSGILYRFHVRPAGENLFDAYLRIEKPPGDGEAQSIPAKAKGGSIPLIRAMRLGRVPPDAQVASAKDAVVYETDAITLRAKLTYATADHCGYVMELANRSKDQAYRVDLSRFAGPNLILAGARDLVVNPGASTRLYFVFGK